MTVCTMSSSNHCQRRVRFMAEHMELVLERRECKMGATGRKALCFCNERRNV